MLNHFNKNKQSKTCLLVLITWAFLYTTLHAETLNEAIQHSLVTNPSVIFSPKKDLLLAPENSGKSARSTSFSSLASGLNLKHIETYSKNKGLCVTNDLAFQVLRHYLMVLSHEKQVDIAKSNLRLHRSIYLTNTKDTGVSHRQAKAERQVLAAQAAFYQAQKKYAKTVGKWPSELVLPQVPRNADLPTSVGQAIEQGIDNYLFILSSQDKSRPNEYTDTGFLAPKHAKHLIKKRSMLELSKSIRAAWDEWTVLGLKLNMLRKELAEVAMLRDAQQEAFKEGKASAIELLEAQGKLYQAQIAYNRYEYKEIQARFYILDSVGSLLTHINAPPIEQDKTMEIGAKDTDLRATEALAEMDKIANPYPDYNFEFNVDLDDNMSLFKDPLVSNPKSPWYISAGYFDNKANAIALVNRLNALGFMASSIISKKGINVIVGPYDFPRQARTGMRRLQEMAHVQGVLMASK